MKEEKETQSNPVYKETLWEWRSFGRPDPNIYKNILSLPIKVGKSIKMLDRYLCKPGCEVNIKLRDKDLKIKSLLCKTNTGIEQWATEVYNFPISASVFRKLTSALKLEIKEREVEDGKQLLSILSHASKSIKVINVQKQRELHIWPPNSKDAVTIELAEISKPECVTTISVEHQNLKKVSKALELLQLVSASMKVLNYVDCLKVWVDQGKLFE
ncbi:MAG: hypothetical protein ACTHKP_10975 [Nitrososphaeraceae archaeon]